MDEDLLPLLIELAQGEARELPTMGYGSSKEGRKRKLPNSVLIVDELSKRFPGRSRTKTEE
jgi:hypothetical protein